MTDLRARIEQHITDLRVERDIADRAVDYVEEVTGAWTGVELSHETLIHAMRQDPATTIARIDRELAGCAADLALLDEYPMAERGVPLTWGGQYVLANLEARYPSEESS